MHVEPRGLRLDHRWDHTSAASGCLALRLGRGSITFWCPLETCQSVCSSAVYCFTTINTAAHLDPEKDASWLYLNAAFSFSCFSNIINVNISDPTAQLLSLTRIVVYFWGCRHHKRMILSAVQRLGNDWSKMSHHHILYSFCYLTTDTDKHVNDIK